MGCYGTGSGLQQNVESSDKIQELVLPAQEGSWFANSLRILATYLYYTRVKGTGTCARFWVNYSYPASRNRQVSYFLKALKIG